MKEADPVLCRESEEHHMLYALLARKGEVPRALALLRNFNSWMKDFEVNDLNMPIIRQFMESGTFLFPRDAASKLLYMYPARLDPALMAHDKEMMQMSYFTMMHMYQQNIDTLREGFVMVEDFTDTTLGHLLTLSRGQGSRKQSMDALQDHLPARIRMVYLVNAPLWIRIPLALFRPFMKQKLREKFMVVTQEQLIEAIGQNQVPEEMGGTLELSTESTMARFNL